MEVSIFQRLFVFIFLFISFSAIFSQHNNNKNIDFRKPNDPLRECRNNEFRKSTVDNLIMPEIAWGNNPQEAEYRNEIIRLLRLEISNVDTTIIDISKKHKELIKLYPELKNYQEIVLENNPGSWRDGIYVNSKKVLSLHYKEKGEIDCVVLD